jgi:hypothetical protein
MNLHELIFNSDFRVGGVDLTGIPSYTLDAAKKHLFQYLETNRPNFPLDQNLEVDSFDSTSWPDASLGSPKDGHFYTQGLVPGYKIVFKIGEESFTMHTNQDGTHVVGPFCLEEGVFQE